MIKAINNSVPTLAVSVPVNEVLFNAIGELSNIADYLSQMKGHKSLAAATGDRAYYSNNRLTEQIRSAVERGQHFYTLTYSPKPYIDDGKWHKIGLAVDGPLTVSYRQGYFAQPSAETERLEAGKTKDIRERSPCRVHRPTSRSCSKHESSRTKRMTAAW